MIILTDNDFYCHDNAEYQQRQLQSNISMLSPKETDLAEIRWQEKEIIRLLNEQQSHQEDYDKLHKLQQKQLEEQTALFQQERKVGINFFVDTGVDSMTELNNRLTQTSSE